MARTYRINGTLALKPVRDNSTRGELISISHETDMVVSTRQKTYLFDTDLTVEEILDNSRGFHLFETTRDRISAALVGTSAVTIFFFLSFISSM